MEAAMQEHSEMEKTEADAQSQYQDQPLLDLQANALTNDTTFYSQ